MIIAIEGMDGVGKTSAINHLNQFMKLYPFGQKYPAYSYEGAFFSDAEYIKNTIKLNTEIFFSSKSFIERANAVRNIDFLHYTDKMLTRSTLERNATNGDVCLYDRYCLSQAVYAKAMMDILIEELNAKYNDMPDYYSDDYLRDLRYDVGDNFYNLPRAKLTIVFVANTEEVLERTKNRESNELIDTQVLYQNKVNSLYNNREFVERNSNSEHTVIVDTTGMTVVQMANRIEELVAYYSRISKK